MKCDTQLLYSTSGPTASEDGSCRASDTCTDVYALDTVQWRQTHNKGYAWRIPNTILRQSNASSGHANYTVAMPVRADIALEPKWLRTRGVMFCHVLDAWINCHPPDLAESCGQRHPETEITQKYHPRENNYRCKY